MLLEDSAGEHRRILYEYSTGLLDQMISIVTTATLIAYILYTVSAETVAKFGSDKLKYTIPFVLYGIFRYLYLVYQKNEGGALKKHCSMIGPYFFLCFVWAGCVCCFAVALLFMALKVFKGYGMDSGGFKRLVCSQQFYSGEASDAFQQPQLFFACCLKILFAFGYNCCKF